ncbi:MAG: SpoIIE family protein phosphatase [Bacteroidota bacterium]|nr:SpoIIE family protein phosphatase [Bacteroidota bacterium]
MVDSIEKKESNKNDFVLIEANLKLYKEANSDTLKLRLLNQIVENCYDETIWPKYNRLMYNIANDLVLKEKDPVIKNKYLNSKALAINNFGYYIQNYTKNPDKSLALYRESAKIFKETGFNTGLVTSNNNIANQLYNNGKILEALDIYHETIKIQQQLKNVAGLTPLLNNIAETYIFIGDSAKAYVYLKRALASALQVGDKHMIAQELQNVGVLANYRGQKDYAIACMKKALSIREQIGDLNGVSKSKINLSTWLLKEKKYTTSKQYLDEVTPYVTNTDNLALKYLFFSGYGQYYIAIEEPEKAEYYLEQSLKYTRANKSIQDEHKIIALLLELYKTYKNDNKELELHRKNAELNKILNGSELKRNTLRKNYEFEYAKKEQEYKIEQAIKDEKSKSEKRRQQFITYGILVFLLLALIFSFFIFKAFKITKQKNNIISTQKQEVEKQKHLIEEKQKEIVDSINYAKRIQTTLLANDDVLKENLAHHFILFKPKDIVSGDFYWANSIKTNSTNLFFLAVCDSTGHGVPGAFMSLLNTNFLNEAINEKHIYEPNNVFNYVRERLINSISKESQKDGFDGILLCIDKQTNKITYSAANNSPILIKQNKEIIKLTCDKMPVGKGEINTAFNLFAVNYEKGDTLYLYTDGFADQFGGPKGKKYKYKPLNDFIISINNLPFNQQCEQLNSKFQEWKGDLEQVDDVCIIGIQL